MKQNFNLIQSRKKIISLFDENQTFVAFDTEATGIDVKNENIIEIAAVKFNKNGIIEKFSTLVNPQKEISPFISELTGITNQMIQNQPGIQNALEDFLIFIENSVLVAHNAQFDLRIVNEELNRLERAPLKNYAVDTLRFSRIFLPENESWKLSFLAEQFKIKTGTSHRAMEDSLECFELFKILLTLPQPPKKRRGKGKILKTTLLT